MLEAPSLPPRPAPAPRVARRACVTAKTGAVALTVGALGVVFGDIGTSPLYAIQTVFAADDGRIAASAGNVYGIISLVVWAVILVVTVKYVCFVLRADNDGEGGIMALTALVQRIRLRRAAGRTLLVLLGLAGAALFYGDGMITPAISVLSAVEGLEVVEPGLGELVVPLTVGILVGLFALQRFGTSAVGKLFGPVMVAWFAVLAIAGAAQIVQDPGVLRALSPTYGASFLAGDPALGFIALGSVVLVVTGAEALYADMGHFGAAPIRRAWLLLVFPALTLNYLGQGSLILGEPEAIANPFYLLLPEWGRIPMVFLATAATVIASQALISGAFSITRQAVQLGFLPRLSIRHTSSREEGQIYVPAVNWALLAGVVAIVVGFGSAASLASAYGVAVTGTFVFTTILFLVVARHRWNAPTWVLVLGGSAFLALDVLFFSSNLTKVAEGGWLPLSIGIIIFAVLTTWRRGREIVTANRMIEEGPLREFVESINDLERPLVRVPGTGVYLNADPDTTPLAMRAAVEHHQSLHRCALILTVEMTRAPHVPEAERLTVDDLGNRYDGIAHITIRFGFTDEPDVPAALRGLTDAGLERHCDLADCSYFLSRIAIAPTDSGGMARWRKRLFVAISRNSASPADYFRLPRERTVITGAQISI